MNQGKGNIDGPPQGKKRCDEQAACKWVRAFASQELAGGYNQHVDKVRNKLSLPAITDAGDYPDYPEDWLRDFYVHYMWFHKKLVKAVAQLEMYGGDVPLELREFVYGGPADPTDPPPPPSFPPELA